MSFVQSVLYLSAAIFISSTALADGPSFPCDPTKTTPVEKLICSDANLSKLDLELAQRYKDVLSAPTLGQPGELKRTQRAWAKTRNQCATTACLTQSYQDRVRALEAMAKTSVLDPASTLKQIEKECATPYDRKLLTCKVAKFKKLTRKETPAVYSVQYRFASKDPEDSSSSNGSGAALYTLDPDQKTVHLLWTESSSPGEADPQVALPELHQISGHSVIYVSVSFSGTGNNNEDRYFILADGKWLNLESEHWQTDVAHRLPQGRSINKGYVPDLKTMTAESGVWKSDDPNCCPTGGAVSVKLKIKDHALAVDHFKYDPNAD